jgi:hypothetical protein
MKKFNHEELRNLFETSVKKTPSLKDNTPLGIIEVHGQFQGYFDNETDNLFIGFIMGVNVMLQMEIEEVEEELKNMRGKK